MYLLGFNNTLLAIYKTILTSNALNQIIDLFLFEAI